MKENWIQLIDTIEKDPFETEAFFALMEYVGEASDDDKRRVVQEVERRIKMIARYDADKSFRFRKFNEQEREVLDSLWSTRKDSQCDDVKPYRGRNRAFGTSER